MPAWRLFSNIIFNRIDTSLAHIFSNDIDTSSCPWAFLGFSLFIIVNMSSRLITMESKIELVFNVKLGRETRVGIYGFVAIRETEI